MKKTRTHRVWFLLLLVITICSQVKAQYMPVVFDKKYGDKNQIQQICPLSGDEVAMIGKEGQKYNLTWVGREGEVVFSLPLIGFTKVNEVTGLDNDCILIVGQSAVQNTKSRKDRVTLSGRAIIVNRSGKLVNNIYAGAQGSDFLKGFYCVAGRFFCQEPSPKEQMNVREYY